MRTVDKKAMVEEIADGYEEAMKYELIALLTEYINNADIESIYSEDISDIVDSWETNRPDENTWSWNEMESKLDDIADQQYELAKDRSIGL